MSCRTSSSADSLPAQPQHNGTVLPRLSLSAADLFDPTHNSLLSCGCMCVCSAYSYLQQFPSPLASIIAQCTAYVSGAVVGVLLVLTFVDTPGVVLQLRVWDRSLLWYLAFFRCVLVCINIR
jgi:hypothetical protein